MNVRAALLALPLGACASAMDATREGQPVVDATLAQVLDNPEAWDGKWVRLHGAIDAKAILLSDERGASLRLYLDPAKKARPTLPSSTVVSGLEVDGDAPGTPVVVSGQVDLHCWRFWQSIRAQNDALFKSEGRVFEAWGSGRNAYCNTAIGPNLANVLVASPPETPR